MTTSPKDSLRTSSEACPRTWSHPIGLYWTENRSELFNSLSVCNTSYFAHRFRSADDGTWRLFRDVVAKFLQRVIALAQAERQSPFIQQISYGCELCERFAGGIPVVGVLCSEPL